MKQRRHLLITPLMVASLSLSGFMLVGCGDDQAGEGQGYEAEEDASAPRGDPVDAEERLEDGSDNVESDLMEEGD